MNLGGMARWGSGALALLLLGCGGKAVIDPIDGAGGAGAGEPGPGVTNVSSSTGGPVTTTSAPPVPAVDGVARPIPEGWQLRVVSYPMTCATVDIDPPFGDCGWYDIDITLFVDELTEGLVITPDSGLGTATASSNGTGPNCGGAGTGGGLFGEVTILSVDSDAVVLALDEGWDVITVDPSLSPLGEHRVALCD